LTPPILYFPSFPTRRSSDLMSFLLRFKRLCLFLEKNLDSICSPHRDASTEEIRIFGPHCICQSECCGEYWPITFVSTAQSLSGLDRKSTRLNSSHLGISYAV